MQSPFKIFRKHQKGVMVVMVFAALILFGVGDIFIRMQRSGASRASGKPVVETTAGSLTQAAMSNLIAQRRFVHRFIAAAYQKSHPEMEKSPFFGQLLPIIVRQFGFGGTSQGEVLYAWLHRQEARKMGIVVSDKQIEDYIDRITDRKLSTRLFREIIDDMRVGPKQLFDMFREELQADIAQKMKLPAYLPSPEKYWEYYQQLKTREKIEAAALPVRDFADTVPDPTEAQIAALFEKHKDDFEAAFDGEFKPGFRQQRKVKLHYLVLSSSAIEDKLLASGPVTDKEVEEYYERHKDDDTRFHEIVAPPFDESQPLDPDFVPEKGPALEPDAGKRSDAKSDETGKSSDQKSDCGSAVSEESDAVKPQAKDNVDENDAKSADSPAKKDADENDDAGAASDTKEASGAGDDNPGTTATGKSRSKKGGPPTFKYKPLDEQIREQIRESVLQDRRQKIMKEQTAKAVEAMREIGLRLSTSPDIKLTEPNAEQLRTIELRSDDELRKIADQLGMKFDKTPLVTAQELSETPGLGKAVEAGTSDAPRSDVQSIVALAFDTEALCRVFAAETLSPEASYVCWKVQDAPIHVPKLTEPGIREQVVKAWKRMESLPLARKRADELAERVKRSDSNLAVALGSETVTGDPRGLAITVSGESPEFSFYRDSSAPNMFRQQRGPSVELGNPIVVNNPGRKFMRVVFDDLAPGEIGVALNDDASVYYIVKVTTRRPAEREAFKDAPLFSQSSPYAQLAQFDLQDAMREYNSRVGKAYAVKWNEVAAREVGPMDEE